ncbi:MAG: hypothetical protein Q7T78_05065 [Rhodoferax sp.]|nr:hypothetical protein [Rhodoferax sp.]
MKFFIIAAALLFIQAGVSAQAQTTTGQSAPAAAAAQAQTSSFRVEGYGRLRFGMDAEQIKSVLKLDFPQANPVLIDRIDAVSRSRVLTLELPALDPGPGVATISCVFGATSQRLIAVNVIWLASSKASQAQETLFINAAARLAKTYAAQPWPLFNTTYGTVVAPGVSVVFTGHDEAGGAAEIKLQGVTTPLGSSSGPSSLRLTLVANSTRPDIYRLAAGSF